MRPLISGVVAVLLAHGQSFEVASVKLNVNCDGSGLSRGATEPGRLLLECADLRDLILTAYGIYAGEAEGGPAASRVQVTGGPAWIDSDRFDLAAVAPGNPIRDVILGPMLRSLLEERFGLKVHREAKDGPIFKLTVAKSGLQVKPSEDRSCALPDPSRPAEAPRSTLPQCGSTSVHADGTVDFWGITMMDLSARLGTVLDREVVDSTGLTERYDVHLQVNPSDLNPRYVAGRERAAEVESGSSIFSALERQLGLKLEPARGPVQSIVIDRIEHPSEN